MKTQKIYKNKTNLQVCIVENQYFNYEPSTIMPLGKGWQYNFDIIEDTIKYPNGQEIKVYYATSFRLSKKMGLNEIINAFIRCLYTIDDELAIQRQRDTKPEKFEKYNNDIKNIITVSNMLYKKFE